MSTLAELARIRTDLGLAPADGLLWLGIGFKPPKQNAIEIDPTNLPTAHDCRAVAGLDVVLVYPGNQTRYGVLRTLVDRDHQRMAVLRKPQP